MKSDPVFRSPLNDPVLFEESDFGPDGIDRGGYFLKGVQWDSFFGCQRSSFEKKSRTESDGLSVEGGRVGMGSQGRCSFRAAGSILHAVLYESEVTITVFTVSVS